MSSCFVCLCAGVFVWSSASCWLCHLQPAHPPEEVWLCCHLNLSTAFLAPLILCVRTPRAPSCLCCSIKSRKKELQVCFRADGSPVTSRIQVSFFCLLSSIIERALRHLTLPQLQGRTHDVSGLATFVLFLIWTATSYLDWFLSLGKKM